MKAFLVITVLMIVHLTMNDIARAGNEHERSPSDVARDKTSKPNDVLEFLGVKKGDHVLDFLGGNGYYSVLLGKKVGSKGKVVLHNNKAYIPFVEKSLNESIAKGELDKVTRMVSEVEDLKFGEEKFDSAILVLAYHDFFHKDKGWDFSPDKAMPQLLKSLKKGGKLLIIDHQARKGAGKLVTKSLHRIEGSFVKQDIINRGFKFIKESSLLKNDLDPHDISVFLPLVRRKTDRFVYLFEKK
jgi:predicted methyltransferase